MELLLPMAAKKLDLSFNIEPDVPFCTSGSMVWQLVYTYSVHRGLRGLCSNSSR